MGGGLSLFRVLESAGLVSFRVLGNEDSDYPNQQVPGEVVWGYGNEDWAAMEPKVNLKPENRITHPDLFLKPEAPRLESLERCPETLNANH